MIEPKTILVAGGAGKLGHKCVNLLLKQKHKVICVDNFCRPDSQKKLERIKPQLENQNFLLMAKDLTEYNEMYTLFERYPIDGIIYLAGTDSDDFSLNIKDNFLGFATMFDLARKANVKGIVHFAKETVPVDSTENEMTSALRNKLITCIYHTYSGTIEPVLESKTPKQFVEIILNIVEQSTNQDNL